MSSLVCSHCGCSEIDIDQARGDAVCTQCGSVLEDQIIVSEVQFAENSGGGSSVIGQYVSADGPKSMGLGGAFHHGGGKESRQVTLENGKNRIQRLGAQLKLNQHCIDTAFNFYKMAVSRQLTRGRRTNQVIAACVYIVCRTEGTSHMLLDFSDVLQIDVYTLGRTYLQLSKELCINIPALDPCLYIQRFAHKLEFGEKTHDVSMTALRLVQRMKRDWMAQGRRPSGLCGAALLVAGRMHDFSRKVKDMIKVVKISEGTIRKRLAEFDATPSSQLTIDEFQKIDLEEEMDPPCFTEGKRKAKMQQHEEQGQLNHLTDEILELQEEIDKAIEQANAKKMRHYKRYTMADTSSEASISRASSPEPVLQLTTNTGQEVQSFLISETLKDVISEKELGGITSNPTAINVSIDVSMNNSNKVSQPSTNTSVSDTENSDSGLIQRPSIASLGITRSVEDYMTDTSAIIVENTTENAAEDLAELDLTGISDSEIDMWILNEDEVQIKTKIWMKANADYLKEQKEKQEREAREREEAAGKPDSKKKKRPRKKQIKVEHSTAADAIKKMLLEKKISSKINYDVLKDLNKTTTKDVEETDSVFGSGPLEATPVHIHRVKRQADSSPSKIETKKQKVLPVVKQEVKQEAQVIVESGPVQYDQHLEDEEEEEEEEEEEHVSAAALLGHGRDVEDYPEFEDDDVG